MEQCILILTSQDVQWAIDHEAEGVAKRRDSDRLVDRELDDSDSREAPTYRLKLPLE